MFTNSLRSISSRPRKRLSPRLSMIASAILVLLTPGFSFIYSPSFLTESPIMPGNSSSLFFSSSSGVGCSGFVSEVSSGLSVSLLSESHIRSISLSASLAYLSSSKSIPSLSAMTLMAPAAAARGLRPWKFAAILRTSINPLTCAACIMPPSALGAEDEVILTPSSACRVACTFAVADSCAAAETVAASLAVRFAGGGEARADSETDSLAIAFSDALLAKFSSFDKLGICKPATVT